MPSFQIPDPLARYAPERELRVTGSTAGEALAGVFERYPALRVRVVDDHGRLRSHLVLFADGVEVARDALAATAVAEDSRLELVAAAGGGARDVRMRGFENRTTVAAARAAAVQDLAPLGPDPVPLAACVGRVLAQDIVSDVAVPPFRRSAMDGYAVRAENTFGAALYEPVTLTLCGESMPGGGGAAAVGPGGACRIMTGAPVPDGADAVLKAEDATEQGESVLVHAPIPPGKNVGRIGEDISVGDVLLHPGRRVRPQDVGLLASIGCEPVPVRARPRVRILVTGNELLPPGGKPAGHSIVDSNSPMLTALIERDGGEVESIRRLPDERDAIRAALAEDGAHVVLTSGGTSVGREDYIPLLVAELGSLDVHGISMRPSSPTGIGRVGAARVFLLPGNPVSCLCAYDFFAAAAIRTLAGRSTEWPHRSVRLPLAAPLVSQIGRTDYARVGISDGRVQPIAVSGASILSSATRAAGFVVIPSEAEGHPAGAEVDVFLYDDEGPGA